MKFILRLLITLLLVNLSLINFSKAQNKRDEKGWKQGMHSENDRFQRKIFNYKNDTLHGFYAEYRDDTIFQTGFYKNGFKDSIWSYYENGIISE
jgi:antitoxin component YwqK of YwqJK toxin-antitoxin module